MEVVGGVGKGVKRLDVFFGKKENVFERLIGLGL